MDDAKVDCAWNVGVSASDEALENGEGEEPMKLSNDTEMQKDFTTYLPGLLLVFFPLVEVGTGQRLLAGPSKQRGAA